MRGLAILFGAASICGQAYAGCEPTDPGLLEKPTILVGEIVDYQKVPIPQGQVTCMTSEAEFYPEPSPGTRQNPCAGVDAYFGFTTIHVVDALKGGEAGDVSVLVTGLAVNGTWYTTDFSPGERFIFGLGQNKPRRRETDHGQLALQYRVSGFNRVPLCTSPVLEASEDNIAQLRAALNEVPFIHSTSDDSLRELPGDDPVEDGCWIKQRKGTDWKKVEIPCQ